MFYCTNIIFSISIFIYIFSVSIKTSQLGKILLKSSNSLIFSLHSGNKISSVKRQFSQSILAKDHLLKIIEV